MEDLIGGLLLVMAAMAAISLLIAVALGMVAASALAGVTVVGLRGTVEFLRSLAQRVQTRGGTARTPLPPEPAYELYVLHQLRRDLRSAGEDAWTSMMQLRAWTAQFASRHGEGVTMPLAIGAVVGGYVGTGVGAAVSILLALPVLLVAAIIMGASWVAIGGLRAAEWLRHRARRTSYECPVDHERFALPVYVCPGCGAQHKRLVPGRWGVIKRECQCGRVALPTMVLNGRQRVPQICPSGHPIAGLIGYTELLRVALVAGPRAGKSTFLAGALHELEALSETGSLALGVVDESRAEFDTAMNNLRKGLLPPKTQGRSPAVVAEVQGSGRSRALSLYDVAGESYAGDDEIRDLRFLERPSGLLLLVDPLSLERFADDRAPEIAAAEDRLRPSNVPPIRVLERTLGALSEAGVRTDKLPLAVVVGKTDALAIGDEIAALEGRSNGRSIPTWLEQQGGGNFVRAVEDAFPRVGWFSASALGRMPDPGDQRPFEPTGTAEPVLWILQQNGVVPAPTKFAASHDAQRLSGASAGDFPPISSTGWALRSASAAALSLAVIAGLAIALTQALTGLSTARSSGGLGSTYHLASSSRGASSHSSSSTDPAGGSAGSGRSSSAGQRDSGGQGADGVLPPVSREQMREDVQQVLYQHHEDIVGGDYRAAWDLLSQRKQVQETRKFGYDGWVQNQKTIANHLDPTSLHVSIRSLDAHTGVATILVTGMGYHDSSNPSCTSWTGITWARYENGHWRYDPGYSTTPQRTAEWKPRFHELLGGSCSSDN